MYHTNSSKHKQQQHVQAAEASTTVQAPAAEASTVYQH